MPVHVFSIHIRIEMSIDLGVCHAGMAKDILGYLWTSNFAQMRAGSMAEEMRFVPLKIDFIDLSLYFDSGPIWLTI